MAFTAIIHDLAVELHKTVGGKSSVSTIEETIRTFMIGDGVQSETSAKTSVKMSAKFTDDEAYVKKVRDAIDKLADDSVYNITTGRSKKTAAAKKDHSLVVIESLRIAGKDTDAKFILVRDALNSDVPQPIKAVAPPKSSDARTKYIEAFGKLKPTQVLNLDSMMGKDVVVAKKTLSVVSDVYMGLGIASKSEKKIEEVMSLFGAKRSATLPVSKNRTSISQNAWGNHEHTETGIVFVASTKGGKQVYQAVGVQDKTADKSKKGKLSLLPLGDAEMQIVKEKEWPYDDTYCSVSAKALDVVDATESIVKKAMTKHKVEKSKPKAGKTPDAEPKTEEPVAVKHRPKVELKPKADTKPDAKADPKPVVEDQKADPKPNDDVMVVNDVTVTRTDYEAFVNDMETTDETDEERAARLGISVEVLRVVNDVALFDELTSKFAPEEEDFDEEVVEDDS
uniref:Uncharacterized protein n=1 Tax=viral metagenome TaxID=1070528 RepID=A0A6C0M0H2_9ZZZZ